MKTVLYFFFVILLVPLLFLHEGHGCGDGVKKQLEKSTASNLQVNSVPPPNPDQPAIPTGEIAAEDPPRQPAPSAGSESNEPKQKPAGVKFATHVVIHEYSEYKGAEDDETESIGYGDENGLGGGTPVDLVTAYQRPEFFLTILGFERGGLRKLIWRTELAEFAAENAAKCHQSSLHYLHEDVEGVAEFSIIGENRYFGDPESPSFRDAVEGWCDGERVHEYGFAWAQLKSKRAELYVGCGKADCSHVVSSLDVIFAFENFFNMYPLCPRPGQKRDEGTDIRIYCEFAPGYEADKEPEDKKPKRSKFPWFQRRNRESKT